MKWLTLSVEEFEPVPKIQFSLKKPLLAASVVLTYEQRAGVGLFANAELKVKLPLKDTYHTYIEAAALKTATNDAKASPEENAFSFSAMSEHSADRRKMRDIHAYGATLSVKKTDDGRTSTETIDIVNDSPVPILAHLFILPAFAKGYEPTIETYGAYIAMGSKIQAIRIDHVAAHGTLETFQARAIRVPGALNEDEWQELPWAIRRTLEFDWDIRQRTVAGIRVQIPVIGFIEIRR